jgi:hypothetical protein
MNSKTPVSPEKLVGPIAGFGTHTVAVYVCAVHVSPWLVAHTFVWLLPILRVPTSIPAPDWYLQHLELVSTVPTLILGYLVARRPGSVAVWAWVIPFLVLLFKMAQYDPPSSVLTGGSISTIRYFFDIQRIMPTMTNPTASDPVRVLAQMTITAPFYAGVAYSLGAWASKQQALTTFLSFKSRRE